MFFCFFFFNFIPRYGCNRLWWRPHIVHILISGLMIVAWLHTVLNLSCGFCFILQEPVDPNLCCNIWKWIRKYGNTGICWFWKWIVQSKSPRDEINSSKRKTKNKKQTNNCSFVPSEKRCESNYRNWMSSKKLMQYEVVGCIVQTAIQLSLYDLLTCMACSHTHHRITIVIFRRRKKKPTNYMYNKFIIAI